MSNTRNPAAPRPSPFDPARRLTAEAIGTAILVSAMAGSGIMADALSGDGAVSLMGNAIPTGAVLVVLMAVFAPISGAHFNPAVTMIFALRREIGAAMALGYIAVQIAGGIAGIMLAHVMFDLPIVQISSIPRNGPGQCIAEMLATAGLIGVFLGGLQFSASLLPSLVGLYVTAAYWFTSSTGFANPAATIARSLTDTFSGIRPMDVPAFIAAETFGAIIAALLLSWLLAPAKLPRREPQSPAAFVNRGVNDPNRR